MEKVYLLEVWSLSTNEWGDRTKTQRVLMNLVTLAEENEDYRRNALMKIVKKMSENNVDNPDYEISSWINDETGALSLMADWGNTLAGNEWYGVESMLTPLPKITEI